MSENYEWCTDIKSFTGTDIYLLRTNHLSQKVKVSSVLVVKVPGGLIEMTSHHFQLEDKDIVENIQKQITDVNRK